MPLPSSSHLTYFLFFCICSIADSPHLPTGPQAAGKNQPKKEDAPFHVPTRKKDSQQQHHQQQQQQQQYQQQQGPGGDVAAGGNGEKVFPPRFKFF